MILKLLNKQEKQELILDRGSYENKQELLRIVRTPEGVVQVDETGKMNGRGAYIKKDLSVLEKAMKSKVLDNKLECKIEDYVYEEIKNIIEK